MTTITDGQKSELIGAYFSEEWGQEKARGMLDDYEAIAAPATAPDELERLRKDAERKPMTREQCEWLLRQAGILANFDTLDGIVRRVEAFHDIKETP